MQDADTLNHHFIVQTYTYSIENHLCYAAKLNEIAGKCTGIADKIFDFEAFLLAYSNAVYEAFIWHLYFLKQGDNTSFSKEEFNRILSLNGMSGFSINNNGEVIINELTTRCNTKVAQVRTTHSLVNLATEQAYFDTLGLNQDNTYLFTRGHNLFDLIVKIGKEVNNLLLTTQAAALTDPQEITELFARATPFQRELERVVVFVGYEEMAKIENKIKTFQQHRI